MKEHVINGILHRPGSSDIGVTKRSPQLTSVFEHQEDFLNLNEILVPMDFSDCSLRALEHAIPLALKLGAKIVLLHVIDEPQVLPMGPINWTALELELRLEAETKFGKLLPLLTRTGVVFEPLVRSGFSHETILDVIQSRKIGIVIMGEHQHKFWQFFRRHTADYVRRKAPCLVQILSDKPALPNRDSESQIPKLR